MRFFENEVENTTALKTYHSNARSGTEAEFKMEIGKVITIEKMISVYSSQEWDSDQPKADAITASQ